MALTAKKLDQVRPTVPVQDAAKGAVVRININVPESTRKTWKKAAIERDMTVTELIEQAVSAYLSK
ncbi:MAG: hypothetical protein M0T84_15505 [Betaproteobacteria bacterium]|nr:hypothetical protein [Betaproteobacteria bacterium]